MILIDGTVIIMMIIYRDNVCPRIMSKRESLGELITKQPSLKRANKWKHNMEIRIFVGKK